MNSPNTKTTKGLRPIHEIAADITHYWPNAYYGAKPYIEAMLSMNNIHGTYGAESNDTIVLYFLSNAGSFRGPMARKLKAELRQHLDGAKQ